MCICFFGTSLRSGLSCLLCFNRDEFIGRPTRHAHFWPDQSHILAGRDLAAGGTWLGVSVTGRLSFLTNLREKEPEPDKAAAMGYCHSRGELTTGFLNSPLSPLMYLQELNPAHYHGFNLVCVNLATLEAAYTNNSAYIVRPAPRAVAGVCKFDEASATDHTHEQPAIAQSSQPQQPDRPEGEPVADSRTPPLWRIDGERAKACPHLQQLEAGHVYGLSNGVLNEWPKVQSGVACLSSLLQQDELWPQPQEDNAVDADDDDRVHMLPWDKLFGALLGDSQRDPSQQPQDPTTGQPLPDTQLDLQQHLGYITSARFVLPINSKFGLYGTRSQTIVAVWEDGVVQVRERYLCPEEPQQQPQQLPHQAPQPHQLADEPALQPAQTAPASDTCKADCGTAAGIGLQSGVGQSSQHPGPAGVAALEQEGCGSSGGCSSDMGRAEGGPPSIVPGPGWSWCTTHHTFTIKLPDMH